jgi:AcrR family transcriptional regulator
MRTPRTNGAILAASERAAWFVIEQGGLNATVAEIAAAIDLNERTFYRYFPTKPEALRPLFDWGAALLADRIAERTDLTVTEASLEAFAEIVGGQNAERTQRLFPLVFADPSMRAVLLAVYHDAEEELRHALSARTGLGTTSTPVYLTAASVVTVTRLALELLVYRGDDPIETLGTLFELLPDPLLGETIKRAT